MRRRRGVGMSKNFKKKNKKKMLRRGGSPADHRVGAVSDHRFPSSPASKNFREKGELLSLSSTQREKVLCYEFFCCCFSYLQYFFLYASVHVAPWEPLCLQDLGRQICNLTAEDEPALNRMFLYFCALVYLFV